MRRSLCIARPSEPVASLHLGVLIFTFKCVSACTHITHRSSLCTQSHAKWLSTQHHPADPLLQTTFTLAPHPHDCLSSTASLTSPHLSLSSLSTTPVPVCLSCVLVRVGVHCCGAAVCASVVLLCVAFRGVRVRRRPGLCMGVVMAFSTRRTALPAKGSNLCIQRKQEA